MFFSCSFTSNTKIIPFEMFWRRHFISHILMCIVLTTFRWYQNRFYTYCHTTASEKPGASTGFTWKVSSTHHIKICNLEDVCNCKHVNDPAVLAHVMTGGYINTYLRGEKTEGLSYHFEKTPHFVENPQNQFHAFCCFSLQHFACILLHLFIIFWKHGTMFWEN